MKELLLEALSSFGYPIILQGSLNDDEPYPDSFFTFWNNGTDATSWYDNDNNIIIWNFDLNFYSTDVELTNDIFTTISPVLKEKGFIINAMGHDVASDEITHVGRGINILYLEYQKEN